MPTYESNFFLLLLNNFMIESQNELGNNRKIFEYHSWLIIEIIWQDVFQVGNY